MFGDTVRNLLALFNPLIIIKIIIQNKYLLFQIIKRNVSLRYKGSILGIIWSFAYPLMMLSIYTFVFGIVFKSRWGIEGLEDNRASFPLIMFCGMAVFNIFSESVNSNTSIIINNSNYIKKVVFPIELLPICNVLTSLLFGIAWFVLLFIGILCFLNKIYWTMLLLPITIIPLLLISIGISFFVSSLGVYLRDIPQIVVILTQILFFMTPIFYPISAVPDNLQWILNINPLSVIVEQTRLLFLYGQKPSLSLCFGMTLLSFIIFQVGFVWFAKTKKGFADVL